ncbi:MAG TPA: S41 family peptidase [Candidatus Obscuribacterales bacterium]
MTLHSFVDLEAYPLEGRALDNVVAFTRLFGYVRYFHPSDRACLVDWDCFAVEGIEKVQPAADAESLTRALQDLFLPIAPSACILAGGPGSQSTAAGRVNRQHDWDGQSDTIRWHHHGLSHTGPFNFFFSSDRIVSAGNPIGAEEAVAEHLPGGLWCRIPTALQVRDHQTLPALDGPPPVAPSQGLTVDRRATRLGIVCLAWNALRFFFPYGEAVGLDWDGLLVDALTASAVAAREQEFFSVLCRLAARLQDGHARAYHPSHDEWRRFAPPIAWDMIGHTLVITRVLRTHPLATAGDADGLRLVEAGDIVVELNGEPVDRVLERASRHVSGSTPEYVNYRALEWVLGGEPGEQITLRLDSPVQGDRTATLTRSLPMWQAPFKRTVVELRPDKLCQLSRGIWYVDLTRITNDDFDNAVGLLESANGIVFDVRGYPPPEQLRLEFLGHFSDTVLSSAHFLTPVLTHPEGPRRDFLWQHLLFHPRQPRLRAKSVFITDERAASYAETLLGIVQHYRIGTIVGRRTGGCNGAPIVLKLPCDYQISWTGMVVLKHDGSRHYGVGIAPDVPCCRTIEAVRSGRDEILELALCEIAK